MPEQNTLDLDSVAEAVEAVRRGELVVVFDDTDRENEGDLIMAATTATAERMAFMIRHTSGIICAPMSAVRAERLHLPPMVANNLDPMRTAFTVSVDCREGMTTGISAVERANTVRALASETARPSDFLRPGHLFPLIGRAGGVLTRSGHTEAAIDLSTMAGLSDVAVLAEVVNDDGTVKRLDELIIFARAHGLKIVTIEDLIAARVRDERLVRRVHTERITLAGTDATVHVYATPIEPWQQIAVTFGDFQNGKEVPTRICREQPIRQLVEAQNGDFAQALDLFGPEKRGIFILLRGPEAISVSQPELGGEEQHASAHARRQRWREVGVGAQILRDLGVESIALITSQERGYVGLAGHGIRVSRVIQV